MEIHNDIITSEKKSVSQLTTDKQDYLMGYKGSGTCVPSSMHILAYVDSQIWDTCT